MCCCRPDLHILHIIAPNLYQTDNHYQGGESLVFDDRFEKLCNEEKWVAIFGYLPQREERNCVVEDRVVIKEMMKIGSTLTCVFLSVGISGEQ